MSDRLMQAEIEIEIADVTAEQLAADATFSPWELVAVEAEIMAAVIDDVSN